MSNKHERISEFALQFAGGPFDPRYQGFFVLFNRAQFYEAHDVLEDLWLISRSGPDNLFYKGLIQLAGAFVHLQKNRLKPATALFKLAHKNITPYPPLHHGLDTGKVDHLIQEWEKQLERGDWLVNPLTPANHPNLGLAAGSV